MNNDKYPEWPFPTPRQPVLEPLGSNEGWDIRPGSAVYEEDGFDIQATAPITVPTLEPIGVPPLQPISASVGVAPPAPLTPTIPSLVKVSKAPGVEAERVPLFTFGDLVEEIPPESLVVSANFGAAEGTSRETVPATLEEDSLVTSINKRMKAFAINAKNIVSDDLNINTSSDAYLQLLSQIFATSEQAYFNETHG
jgi:hypothetical protein